MLVDSNNKYLYSANVGSRKIPQALTTSKEGGEIDP